MGHLAEGVRPFVVALTATGALVVPFAADAHAPTAPTTVGHHAHATAGSEPVADPSDPVSAVRALPRIKGQVGPGATITVNRSSVVKGRYRIVVQDDSTAHSWHISGPGDVSRKTSVSGTGKWVWKVRLRRGTYTIVCDVHPNTMNTSLRVTAD